MAKPLIQLRQLIKSFGNTTLFDQINLSVNETDCFALIGENGAGKTSLLQLLAGTLLPDEGEIIKAPNLTIGFLAQEIDFPHLEITSRQYIEENNLSHLERQMATCLDDPSRLDEWAELQERYEALGGYRQLPLEKVLKALDLEEFLDLQIASLSSGQRMRMALAKSLKENPDLLLLDEPTSHLDLGMYRWLCETLEKRRGATIIVSHDRKFLNETCNHLLEIRDQKLRFYGGNYNFYLDEREREVEQKLQAYKKQQDEKASLKQQIKKMTFSKKKTPPPSDRNVMAYDRWGEKQQKSVSRTLDQLKSKLEEIEKNPLQHPKPKTVTGLRFTPTHLASTVVLELNEISKSYNKKCLFSNLSRQLRKGERIIITGPNGSGKTTLLQCIAGVTPLDSGEISFAPSATVAYLDQEIEMLPMQQTPLEYFESRFNLSEEGLRRELHKAALGGVELINRAFNRLSTGQRKRLMLLSLVLEKPNVLLLDEPTNYLDLLTLEALEKALLNFKGAILAISHDATFIEKLATDRWTF